VTTFSTEDLLWRIRVEDELLLCCARSRFDGDQAARAEVLLQNPIDWTYLLQMADRHKVLTLLYQNLSEISATVPVTGLPEGHRYYSQAYRMRNASLAQKLVELLGTLGAEGIRSLPFKGPVLEVSYKNGAVREFSDLDILVDPADYDRAQELLLSKGYERVNDFGWECCLHDPAYGVSVDLHQGITGDNFPISVDFEDLWGRRRRSRIGGADIDVPSVEDTLLIQSVHFAKDGCADRYKVQLLKICDISELLSACPDLDWQKTWYQARRWGCRRVFALALYTAHVLLAAPVPNSQLRKLTRHRQLRFLAGYLVEGMFAEHQADSLAPLTADQSIYFTMRERWRDKLYPKYISQLQPNERDRAFVALPASFSSLYYVIKPVRLLRNFGKAALGRIRGSEPD
jgi:hypothetical protein